MPSLRLSLSNVFVVLRMMIGGIFVVSGFEKLIAPHQNFQYVIESYQVLPRFLEIATAFVFPWIEFFTGLFVVVGLGLGWALRTALLLLTVFIVVVAQAIVRKLPITECGCFGELFSFPLKVVIVFDSFLFLLTSGLLLNVSDAKRFSLDQYFLK